MASRILDHRLLPANSKAIQRAVKTTVGAAHQVIEFRIENARGLVLHVLPSGTATWYVHYDVEVGKTRTRRKFKIGRLDEVSLAQALSEAERLRPLIRQGADPVSQKIDTRKAMTFVELAAERIVRGEPLRPGTQRDYGHVLRKDILPLIGHKPAKAYDAEKRASLELWADALDGVRLSRMKGIDRVKVA